MLPSILLFILSNNFYISECFLTIPVQIEEYGIYEPQIAPMAEHLKWFLSASVLTAHEATVA